MSNQRANGAGTPRRFGSRSRVIRLSVHRRRRRWRWLRWALALPGGGAVEAALWIAWGTSSPWAQAGLVAVATAWTFWASIGLFRALDEEAARHAVRGRKLRYAARRVPRPAAPRARRPPGYYGR